MSRLPLSLFLPINSESDLNKLIGYLSSLKPRERYDLVSIVRSITKKDLLTKFRSMTTESNLYPKEEIERYRPLERKDLHKEYKQSVNSGNKFKFLGHQKSNNVVNNKKNKRIKIHIVDSCPTWDLNNKSQNAIKTKSSKRKKTKATDSQKTKCAKVWHVGDGKLYEFDESKLTKLVNNVMAVDFVVTDGRIEYKNMILTSHRIQSALKDSLAKIDKVFTLILYPHKGEFRFHPATDLNVMIDEIARVKKVQRDLVSIPRIEAIVVESSRVQRYPQNGMFSLPWEYVIFNEGELILSHPNASKYASMNPFRFHNKKIHRNYRDFIDYFRKKSPLLKVVCHDNRITSLLNIEDFLKSISHLVSDSDFAEEEVEKRFPQLMPGNNITVDEFRTRKLINKSPYLSFLCKYQNKEHNIYYLKENVVHSSSDFIDEEFGYLFTIKKSFRYSVLVYENITDQSRSSYVFYVDTYRIEDAVKYISRFLASDMENKRERIAQSSIRMKHPAIRLMVRVSHTSYSEWRQRMVAHT